VSFSNISVKSIIRSKDFFINAVFILDWCYGEYYIDRIKIFKLWLLRVLEGIVLLGLEIRVLRLIVVLRLLRVSELLTLFLSLVSFLIRFLQLFWWYVLLS